MKIALYSQKYKPEYHSLLVAIFEELITHQDTILVEADLLHRFTERTPLSYFIDTFHNVDDLAPDTDFMLTIGGDGTILWAMTYIQHLQIPILGINAGRLGFLATISQEEVADMFTKIRAQKYHVDKRSVLQISHTNGKAIAPLNFALNEITVIRQNSTAMITVEAFLNGQYLTSYWADGLIISTPTGSTGYSLSCGGPVIMPHSKTLVLTPIAPHNLNARPLIIPDSTEITLHISNREGYYLATYDARSSILPCQTPVKISLAPFLLKTIELEGNDFFKTLRNKLLWGEDKRN
jgi:probable inorganic polyphosphate/ATP-NAD kinase